MKLSDVRELYNVDNYREALQIDQHRLDDMLMQQPVIQQTIAELHAEVTSMRDAAKERLSRVDAQVAKVLRNRLTVEEGKVSEARIDREVPLMLEHKEAHHVYNELCALSAQWEALKDTVRNRAFVLRDLVSLYTSNFFTDTSFRSQSNPQAVQELAYRDVRAALAEGRRARRTLSGVPDDVELKASVDETEGPDAYLGEVQVSKRASSTRQASARSTTRRNSKKSAAQGLDTETACADTSTVGKISDNGTKPADTLSVSKNSRAAELRARVRRRSGQRVLDAEDDEESSESKGASTLVAADEADTNDVLTEATDNATVSTEAVDAEAATEAGTGDIIPRRSRRRHARARTA